MQYNAMVGGQKAREMVPNLVWNATKRHINFHPILNFRNSLDANQETKMKCQLKHVLFLIRLIREKTA